jgi:hypothetical protein
MDVVCAVKHALYGYRYSVYMPVYVQYILYLIYNLCVGEQEAGKAAVINPKNKFVVDPRVEWHRCSLVIVVNSHRVREKWGKLRSGMKSAAVLKAVIQGVTQAKVAKEQITITQLQGTSSDGAAADGTSSTSEDGKFLTDVSLAQLAGMIQSMSAEMSKISDAVRTTQERVEQQSVDMGLLVARIEAGTDGSSPVTKGHEGSRRVCTSCVYNLALLAIDQASIDHLDTGTRPPLCPIWSKCLTSGEREGCSSDVLCWCTERGF